MRAIATSQMTLCSALDELSETTWLEIDQGVRTNQPLDEESVTSYDLMRLAAAVPGIRLEKHTKKREWKTGADWEIWVGKPGGFLGLRVQAKILDGEPYQPKYKSLYSSKQKATFQIDKLIASARSAPRTMYPVFAFYNRVSTAPGDFTNIRCPRVAHKPLLCGWTIASAYSLQRRLAQQPSKNLSDLVDLMLPISCIFCCPSDCTSFGARRDSLAQRVSAQLAGAWPQDDVSPTEIVHATGPIYVERLYKGERIETGWTDLPSEIRRAFTRERELPKGVSRLLLIRDVETLGPTPLPSLT